MLKINFKEAEQYLQAHGYTLTEYSNLHDGMETKNRHSAYATYTNDHGEEVTLYYYFDREQNKKDSWTAGEVWQVDGNFPMSVEQFLEQIEQQNNGEGIAYWNYTVNKQDDDIYVEFEQYSPAGEDFIFTVWGNTPDAIVAAVREYADDGFDPEAHAAEWYGANKGEPRSLRALLDDADEIDEMLEQLAQALEAAL